MRMRFGVAGWTVVGMLLVAACSDGSQGRPTVAQPTATATQSADAESTPGLPASVRTAIASAQETEYRAFRRPESSPPRFDLTALAQLGLTPDDVGPTSTRSVFDVGRQVLETEHIGFRLAPDSVSEPRLVEYARQIEVELAKIAEKLGVDLSSGFPQGLTMTFVSPESERERGGGQCPVRGMAAPSFGTPWDVGAPVQNPNPSWVVADDETMPEQVVAIAAHELAHHVGRARFGLAGDRLLSEGLATWLARDSWLRWHGMSSLDDAVRGFLSAGAYIPFAQRYYSPGRLSDAECLARRDTLYTEYASFVGFLIDRYGLDRFEELADTIPEPDLNGKVITILSGPGIPTPTPWPTPTPGPPPEPPMPDYRAVYGRSFEELQQDWLEWLRAG